MYLQRLHKHIVLCLLIAAAALFVGKAAVAKAGTGTVKVKITYVAMRRSDVRMLSVSVPPITRRRNDLQALENAARRAHVSFSASDGPTITAPTGKTTSEKGVDITPISVREGRAYVRIRETDRMTHIVRGRKLHKTMTIVANHVYHSGETRRLAGQIVNSHDYRYVFATVTVTP